MNAVVILRILCILTCLFPVVYIIVHKLFTNTSLATLLGYYTATALALFMALPVVGLHSDTVKFAGFMVNLFETPLMLSSLLFFCPVKGKHIRIQLMTAAFMCYELIVLAIFKLSEETLILIIGPGLILVLAYASVLFLRQIKVAVRHGKNSGRTIMLAGLLFTYFCLLLIYYFNYVQHTPFKEDVNLLYSITLIIGCLAVSAGLSMARKRLVEYKHANQTREELKLFFN